MATTIRTPLDVFLGKAEKPLGRLVFVQDGLSAKTLSQMHVSCGADWFSIT